MAVMLEDVWRSILVGIWLGSAGWQADNIRPYLKLEY